MTEARNKFGANLIAYSLHYAGDDYDIEAEALGRVLRPFADALDRSTRRVRELEKPTDDDSWDYHDSVIDEETGYVEDLLGSAFVISQRYITQTVSRFMLLHQRVKDTGTPFACLPDAKRETFLRAGSKPIAPASGSDPCSEVEVIEAFANYFKHHEERDWRQSWDRPQGKPAKVIPILIASGASSSSTGNFRAGARALGNPEFTDLENLVGILRAWRQDLVAMHRHELIARQLIKG